jgi:hypothetical protein
MSNFKSPRDPIQKELYIRNNADDATMNLHAEIRDKQGKKTWNLDISFITKPQEVEQPRFVYDHVKNTIEKSINKEKGMLILPWAIDFYVVWEDPKAKDTTRARRS